MKRKKKSPVCHKYILPIIYCAILYATIRVYYWHWGNRFPVLMWLEIGTETSWVDGGNSQRGLRECDSPSPQRVPGMESSRLLFFPSQSKQSSSYSDRDTTEEESESIDDMDFLTRQKKLQAEAKMALAMAKPMAKMQVEVEKQNRKKSPVADLVSSKCWNASECLVAAKGWRCPKSFTRIMQTWVSPRQFIKSTVIEKYLSLFLFPFHCITERYISNRFHKSNLCSWFMSTMFLRGNISCHGNI